MEYSIAYLLVRLALGVSFLGHGLVRLPKLKGFSEWLASSFEGSVIPVWAVAPFGYVLALVEFAVGLLLVVGVFSRTALVAGSLAMIALILGSCLIEKWEWLPSQMIHVFFAALLLVFVSHNRFSLDVYLHK